jgi:ABC-2 type transport system permease protein
VRTEAPRRRGPLAELTLARFREFWREPGAVFWTFGFPLLLTIALGIAFRSQGAPKVAVAVVQAPGAQDVMHALEGEKRIVAQLLPEKDALAKLRRGEVAIAVVPGQGAVSFRFDPDRPESTPARLLVDDRLQRAAGRADVLAVRDETTSAPGSRYIDWLVPGLLGMQLMSGSMWGIGWAIVQTRSRKLLKRLVATPMRRSNYLLAYFLSRLVFLLVELVVLLSFARLAFGVEVHGSLLSVALLSALGAGSFAGIALLCASRAQNTETAGGLMNLVMLPMFVLSGVFFSAANFPDFLQPVIRALPLTALNDGLRAVINGGASLASLPREIAVMLAWGLVSFGVAVRIFRWT